MSSIIKILLNLRTFLFPKLLNWKCSAILIQNFHTLNKFASLKIYAIFYERCQTTFHNDFVVNLFNEYISIYSSIFLFKKLFLLYNNILYNLLLFLGKYFMIEISLSRIHFIIWSEERFLDFFLKISV